MSGSLRKKKKVEHGIGTSLVVRWLRLSGPNAGGLGLIPGQGTRFHMPQLKIPRMATKLLHMAMKILHATTKT